MKGKCKKDFEKWFKLNVEYDFHGDQSSYNITSDFLDLPHSMQWGVIVDFFDSVGMCVTISRWHCDDISKYYWSADIDDFEVSDYLDTRHEARAAAIEKATEIYNERIK